MKEYTNIIWDFNGTLLDDVDAGIDSINDLLARRSLPTLAGREDYFRVFDFPISDYYRRVGFDFEKEPFETIAHEWMERYLHYSAKSGLVFGVSEALQEFRRRGLPQTVLSATKIETLHAQIASLGIGDYFEELLGLDNIYAASKVALAEKWKRHHPNARPLFLGDTLHDAQVASAIGADCILICRGHQSAEKLRSSGAMVLPDALHLFSTHIFK